MTTAVETYRYGRLPVDYFAVSVPAVIVGRTVYFPVRALSDVLGVAPQMQKKRLREDTRFTSALRDIPVPTVKGQREALCIRKDMVGAWFLLIEPGKCKLASTREKLEHFQRELFLAADRFLFPGKDASHAPATVYAPETGTDAPVTGVLRNVGACPVCGTHLCVVFDTSGSHLAPEPEQDE